MSRDRRPATPPGPPQPSAPSPARPLLELCDDAVYLPEQVRTALRLTASTLRREIRMGRLRVAKRAGRYFLLGHWVREWLEGGELRPSPAPPSNPPGDP